MWSVRRGRTTHWRLYRGWVDCKQEGGHIIFKSEERAAERGTRPEICRNNSIKLLLGRIPRDSIKWGHRLLSATRTRPTTSDHNETELDFGTRGTHKFDLVVGADGAWSWLRLLLTDVKLYFIGTQNIAITFQGFTAKYPHLAEPVGPGSFSALGNKQSAGSHRGPSDSVRINIWLTIRRELRHQLRAGWQAGYGCERQAA